MYRGTTASGLILGGTGGFRFSHDDLVKIGGMVGVGGLRVIGHDTAFESTFRGSVAPAASAVYLILVYSLPSWILFWK